MNAMINKSLLAGDKFMQEVQLRQPVIIFAERLGTRQSFSED